MFLRMNAAPRGIPAHILYIEGPSDSHGASSAASLGEKP